MKKVSDFNNCESFTSFSLILLEKTGFATNLMRVIKHWDFFPVRKKLLIVIEFLTSIVAINPNTTAFTLTKRRFDCGNMIFCAFTLAHTRTHAINTNAHVCTPYTQIQTLEDV